MRKNELNLIEQCIKNLDEGEYQEFCDALIIHRYGYEKGISLGQHDTSYKTTKGTPDTFFINSNGDYIFCEYTTMSSGLAKKLTKDLDSCLDVVLKHGRLVKVIICHNGTNLKPSLYSDLTLKCAKKNILLEILSLDELARYVCESARFLSNRYLSFNIETEQILDLNRFVEIYDSNTLVAPLNIPFQFRDEKCKELTTALEKNKFVILYGEPGVGKTRLAIHVADKFAKAFAYNLCVVRNNGQCVDDDILYSFNSSGNYLILIDDANDIPFIEQLYSLNRNNSSFKFLLTVRKYALEQVTDLLTKYNDYAIIQVNRVKDDELSDIIANQFPSIKIVPLRQVIKIAKGNLRIGFMAARLFVDINFYTSINSINELYYQYYKKFINDSNFLNNPNLLATSLILSVFGPIDIENLQQYDELFDIVKISSNDFINYCHQLFQLEVLEKNEEVVYKLADQCLGNYIIYYYFIYRNCTPLHKFINWGYVFNNHAIIRMCDVICNVFADNNEYFISELSKSWNFFENHDNPNFFYSFVKSFCYFKPTETLIFISESIKKIETTGVECVSSDIVTFIVEVLVSFARTTQFSNVLELLIQLLDCYNKALNLIADNISKYFGISQYSSSYDYDFEHSVVDTLIAKCHSDISKELFINCAFSFVNNYIESFETDLDDTLICYSGYSVVSVELKKLHYKVFNYICNLDGNTIFHTAIFNLLNNYLSQSFISNQISTFNSVASLVLILIKRIFNYNKIQGCILFEKFITLNASGEFDYNFIINSIEWKLFNLLCCIGCFCNDNLDYFDRIGNNKQKFQQEFLDLYGSNKEVVLLVKEIVEYQVNVPFNVIESFDLILSTFASEKEFYRYILEFALKESIPLNPHINIRILFNSYGYLGTYNWIKELISSLKYDWLLAFFEELPESEINEKWTINLVDFITSRSFFNQKTYFSWDLFFLKKYLKFDSEVFNKMFNCFDQKTSNYDFNSYLHILMMKLRLQPESIAELFGRDLTTFCRVYLLMLKQTHIDFDGIILTYLYGQSSSFRTLHLNYSRGLTDSRLIGENAKRSLILWQSEYYEEFFTPLFESFLLVSKNLCYRTDFEDYLITDNKSNYSNRDKWILNMVSKNYSDVNKMKLLFFSITELNEEIRLNAISEFSNNSTDIVLFKELSLLPNHMLIVNSKIPELQKRKEFLSNVKKIFKDLNHLVFSQYIEEKLELMDYWIKKAKISESIRF